MGHGDCDEADAAVNPGATETGTTACNDTIDNDCDGLVDGEDLLGCGLVNTTCSRLGDQPPPASVDADIWTFQGHLGEIVTVRLEADGAGSGRADLILVDEMGSAVNLVRADHTELPNEITVTLPADGGYRIVFLEDRVVRPYVGGGLTWARLDVHQIQRGSLGPGAEFESTVIDDSDHGFGAWVGTGFAYVFEDMQIGLDLRYSDASLDLEASGTPGSLDLDSGGIRYGVFFGYHW